MSVWDERLTSSQSWVLVNQLQTLVEGLPEARDEAELESQQRVRHVADVARTIIVGADPRLVSPRMISDVQTSLSQIVNAVQTYNSGSDPTYLTNANSYSDELLTTLAIWLQRPAREARQTVAALG